MDWLMNELNNTTEAVNLGSYDLQHFSDGITTIRCLWSSLLYAVKDED